MCVNVRSQRKVSQALSVGAAQSAASPECTPSVDCIADAQIVESRSRTPLRQLAFPMLVVVPLQQRVLSDPLAGKQIGEAKDLALGTVLSTENKLLTTEGNTIHQSVKEDGTRTLLTTLFPRALGAIRH